MVLHRLFLFVLLSVLIAFSLSGVIGCNQTPKPEGLPKLYSVTLKILQEGTPLAGAEVMFYPIDEMGKWTHGGRTDENGVAQIVTHGQYSGVPAGKFKVTVSKSLVVEPEADSNMSVPGVQNSLNKVFDLVDLVYKTKDSTPLEIEIQGKITQEFDVGQPVRIEMKFF